jgi:hypothetical protein
MRIQAACRLGLSLSAVAALAGCARGVCDDCPTATLTANGETSLDAPVGEMISYAWSSTNAETGSSTVTMAPAADRCGNHDGPWVVATLAGSAGPSPILACQAGTTYTLSFTATQDTTGDSATAVVTISVPQ